MGSSWVLSEENCIGFEFGLVFLPLNDFLSKSSVGQRRRLAWLGQIFEENPFKYFKTSPEIIKLAVMYYEGFSFSVS